MPLYDYGCTLKAYRREVLENVRLYDETHRFIPIYAAWEGDHRDRCHPPPAPVRQIEIRDRWLACILLDLLIVYFIDRAFDRPIQFFGKFALAFLGLAFATFAGAVVLKYGCGISLIQTPLPLLSTVIGLLGVLFLSLGIIAEVEARIYLRRPRAATLQDQAGGAVPGITTGQSLAIPE